MKILAFDTATSQCTSALWIDGHVREISVHAGQTHSSLVLPHCRQLLDEAGLRLQALDGIAFGCGPGSFTGVRIACAVAQGLALGADLPLVGIETLLALTRSADGDRVLTCLDARMGEVYCAAWMRGADGGWQTLGPTVVCAPGEVPVPDGAGWRGCGSGFSVYADALEARFEGCVEVVDGERLPSASRIAELAQHELGRGGVAPELALPLYVRDRVALKISER